MAWKVTARLQAPEAPVRQHQLRTNSCWHTHTRTHTYMYTHTHTHTHTPLTLDAARTEFARSRVEQLAARQASHAAASSSSSSSGGSSSSAISGVYASAMPNGIRAAGVQLGSVQGAAGGRGGRMGRPGVELDALYARRWGRCGGCGGLWCPGYGTLCEAQEAEDACY